MNEPVEEVVEPVVEAVEEQLSKQWKLWKFLEEDIPEDDDFEEEKETQITKETVGQLKKLLVWQKILEGIARNIQRFGNSNGVARRDRMTSVFDDKQGLLIGKHGKS